MPLATFIPPVAPSPGTSRRPEFKILRADFGDGYSQVMPDGLNHNRKVIELRWDVLTQSQAKAITDFFDARQGTETFLYKHPHEATALKFTCSEYGTTDAAAGLCSMTATLRQSFNLVS